MSYFFSLSSGRTKSASTNASLVICRDYHNYSLLQLFFISIVNSQGFALVVVVGLFFHYKSIVFVFIKSYAAVCLEGVIIILSCIIFTLFASSAPVVNANAAAVTQVWTYIGELVFNMLVLVGTIKMSDRVVREMMGL